MPLNLIKDLDKKAAASISFRGTLKDAPLQLDRAETAFRMFHALRGKILDGAPDVLELKGYIIGIRQTKKFARERQDAIRAAIKEEEISSEVGKPAIAELAAAVALSMKFATSKQEELSRAGGKLEGYYYAALDALGEIERAIAHFNSTQEDDDGDWSGRGTENGQRPVEDGGNGASVTPIASARGGKNGKKKKAAVKKKTATRKPRVKKTKAEAPPPEG
jgi:hypothetical protein